MINMIAAFLVISEQLSAISYSGVIISTDLDPSKN
jgi:hypothetical protein